MLKPLEWELSGQPLLHVVRRDPHQLGIDRSR